MFVGILENDEGIDDAVEDEGLGGLGGREVWALKLE
jgi:hypothetical protein